MTNDRGAADATHTSNRTYTSPSTSIGAYDAHATIDDDERVRIVLYELETVNISPLHTTYSIGLRHESKITSSSLPA